MRTRGGRSSRALLVAGILPARARALGYPDQRASRHLPAITGNVVELIERLGPGVLLTHAYEGGHPDHDAVAFAVHAARVIVDREPPVVLEFTSYHAAGEGIATGEFLGSDSDASGRVAGIETRDAAVRLSPEDRERKRRMLECFATQRETLARFPVASVERFRLAPRYDFTHPPHAGAPHYERFDWGITGAEWRSLAAGALDALAIGEARC